MFLRCTLYCDRFSLRRKPCRQIVYRYIICSFYSCLPSDNVQRLSIVKDDEETENEHHHKIVKVRHPKCAIAFLWAFSFSVLVLFFCFSLFRSLLFAFLDLVLVHSVISFFIVFYDFPSFFSFLPVQLLRCVCAYLFVCVSVCLALCLFPRGTYSILI